MPLVATTTPANSSSPRTSRRPSTKRSPAPRRASSTARSPATWIAVTAGGPPVPRASGPACGGGGGGPGRPPRPRVAAGGAAQHAVVRASERAVGTGEHRREVPPSGKLGDDVGETGVERAEQE